MKYSRMEQKLYRSRYLILMFIGTLDHYLKPKFVYYLTDEASSSKDSRFS